jgi:voltage-gated potassium channel
MDWEQLPNGRVRHPFEPLILVLALLVIPVVLIEETASNERWLTLATVGNWIIWVGFTAELFFVLYVAGRKRAAARAHWLDITIVVLTVPILPSALATLRLVRLIRLARLAALGARAISAERRLTSRQNFRFIALATALLVVLAGASISFAEAENFDNPWRGMWWAITTVTTVGYGDVTPKEPVGRIIAAALMLVGIGFLSLLTAAVAARFVDDDARDVGETLDRVEERLGRLEQKLDEVTQLGRAESGRGSR